MNKKSEFTPEQLLQSSQESWLKHNSVEFDEDGKPVLNTPDWIKNLSDESYESLISQFSSSVNNKDS